LSLHPHLHCIVPGGGVEEELKEEEELFFYFFKSYFPHAFS
jgi:hypothetical protein